jgi:multidrug resistance efflux pump
LKQSEEKAAKLKELYAQGLLSRRDLETGEEAIASAKAKIAEAQKQMRAADDQVAQMMVEAKEMEEMAKAPAPAKGKLTQTASYIRRRWLLAALRIMEDSAVLPSKIRATTPRQHLRSISPA